MNAREAVAFIVEHFEQGFVNHPNDRGKSTKFGVTQATLAAFRGRPVTSADVEALTRDEAIDCLTELFALKPGYDAIAHAGIRLAVIDFAIHSSPLTATRALQRAAGTPKPDGLFGRCTEYDVNHADPTVVVRKLTALRLVHLSQILLNDRSQLVFAAGWMARVGTLLEAIAA